jgi:hypothetical protein
MGKLVRAAIKDAERASRRRQRELQAMAKESARQAEREQAAYQVEVFLNQLELLTSLHREATPPVDWHAHASAPRPELAAPDRSASLAARQALERYQPGFFARLFGMDPKSKLERRLEGALAAEAAQQPRLEQEHAAAVEQWEAHGEYAKAVLAGDESLYNEVLRDTACLEELEQLGCKVQVWWLDATLARVDLRTEQDSVVPGEEKSLTSTGKVSTKKMPAARRMEVYQDYVCGAALRAARELLAVLPLRSVLVNVKSELLNTASGHFEDATVVSVYCPREKMERIHFDRADASDVVSSFVHAMKLSRGKGLGAVQPLAPEDFLSRGGTMRVV